MGLLDFLFQRRRERFDPREAVLGLLLAAARADGVIMALERDALDVALGSTGLYVDLSRAEVQALVENVSSRCGDRWDRILPDLARGVPLDMRTRVFSLCADLAVSDGRLSKAESLVLERVRRPLGLPREQADQLLASAASRKIMARTES